MPPKTKKPKTAGQQNQCVGFDFTYPCEGEHGKTKLELVEHLSQWMKEYVFQQERGQPSEKYPQGYLHWQGRGRLIVKRRENEIKGKFMHHGDFSYTTNKAFLEKNFCYVMKADSRVEGPWTDKDFVAPPVLTRQLKDFLEHDMFSWQKAVLKFAKEVDDRWITLIFDKIGHSGKSIMAEYMEYEQIAFEVPPFRGMEDIMQFCMGFKSYPCYMVDLPRAMKKDKMADFYAGLECLKNGVLYDKRYKGQKRRIDRPQILVFTNVLPDPKFMSLDRWRCFEMNPDKILCPFDLSERLKEDEPDEPDEPERVRKIKGEK